MITMANLICKSIIRRYTSRVITYGKSQRYFLHDNRLLLALLPTKTSNYSTSTSIHVPLDVPLHRQTQEEVLQKQSVLWSWTLANLHNFHPSDDVLRALASITGYPVEFIENWLQHTYTSHLKAVTIDQEKKGEPSFALTESTFQWLGVRDLEEAKEMFMPWNTLSKEIKQHCETLNKSMHGNQQILWDVIASEMDFTSSEGHHEVPSEMTVQLKQDILRFGIASIDLRRKLYGSNARHHHINASKALKKTLKEEARQQRMIHRSDIPPNKIFLKKYDFYEISTLCYSYLHGPNLIMDASFEDTMSRVELNSLLVQLSHAIGESRRKRVPFHFHFTGLKRNGFLHQKMLKTFMKQDVPVMDITISHDCYSTLYEPTDLVVLSPDGRERMKKYDENKTYVVGALVDKRNTPRQTFAKAKRLNITMERLPLELHSQWGSGSTKYLTVNAMAGILLDLKENKPWEETLTRNIATRKFEGPYKPRIKRR